MRVEYLVAFYMLVCAAMTAFNFVFLFNEKVRTKRFEKKMARMAAELAAEIDRNADFPTEEHCRYLETKMKRLAGMEAFDLSMDKLLELDTAKSEHYLRGISSVFEHLVYVFQQKDDLKCAYFAYIVGRWYRRRPCAAVVVGAMLRYVQDRSFYARQNALQALSALGDAKALVSAAQALDGKDSFHHPKLITEALLAFSGDRAELEQEAYDAFDAFSATAQVAVVNFVRMADVGESPEGAACRDRNRAWIIGLLRDESTDAEVRLACIRYFMRHPWDEAEEALRDLASRDTAEEWEFAAIAATALAAYPGKKTVETLKRCLRSPMWHVRFNAAKSLYDMGLSLEDDLADVIEGRDPYARDMVLYRWEYEEMRKNPEKSQDVAAVEDASPCQDGASSIEAEVVAAWTRLSASWAEANKAWYEAAALRANALGEGGDAR